MNNFYNLTTTELSSAFIILNIVFSFILQAIIVWVYKKTHKGLSYSPSFIFTLIIVGILGTVVMMVVQNNLIGAFALFGAFSLIRFRTILKETRDIAFVFFVLVIGVAVGVNHYSIALISTIFISIIILVLSRYNIGSSKDNLGFILTLSAKNNFIIDDIKPTLLKYSNSFNLVQSRSYGVDINNYTFSIKLKNDLDSVSIVKLLRDNQAVIDVELITGEHIVEY